MPSCLGNSLQIKKNQGGLGIIDIKHQNDALLMKYLDKFYNSSDLPWVTLTWNKFYSDSQTPPQARSLVGSFWWKDVLKLFDNFRNLLPVLQTEAIQFCFGMDLGQISISMKVMHSSSFC